jgi:hypothetical protein
MFHFWEKPTDPRKCYWNIRTKLTYPIKIARTMADKKSGTDGFSVVEEAALTSGNP